jgi:alkylation response protein AidB-like acyl-CoA dehydrogenase
LTDGSIEATTCAGAVTGVLVSFRDEVRAWLLESCPSSMRRPFKSAEEWYWGGRRATFPSDDHRVWFERVRERRWLAPHWPIEYGGAGLTVAHRDVLRDEMARLGCRRPLVSLGVSMLGPVLLEHGTLEQRSRFLPDIAMGRVRWCQGYSEPGAGSDLASLRCRARRDGDRYVVDGQKIWNSEAHRSDWMFCLVRTGTAEERQRGITFLLIDMETPGVTAASIVLISGASDFCVTTFDRVSVPLANRLGDEGEGWTLGKRLLEHERSLYSTDARVERGGHELDLVEFARRELGSDLAHADAVLRDQITQVEFDRYCYDLTLRRSAAERCGAGPGPESSMLKLYLSELNQRRADLRRRIAGVQGLGWAGDGFEESRRLAAREWLRSRADTIAGGTSEIQRNVIAKRVLRLPS